jgi:anti-anti-sigma regulatory factor
MTFTREDRGKKDFIKIEGSLSIYEVSKLRDELIKCFETPKGIVLELSGITDCDTAGVQLLCAAQKTASRIGRKFSIEKATVPVFDALNNAGIHPGNILDSLQTEISGRNAEGRG